VPSTAIISSFGITFPPYTSGLLNRPEQQFNWLSQSDSFVRIQ
jgi:hypothetical protein